MSRSPSAMTGKQATPVGAEPGTTTKRKVKSTAKRQYPPPKITMIRAPTKAPIDATVVDTDEDSDEASSSSDDDDVSTSSEFGSLALDDDGEPITTAKPLGKPTKTVRAKTTRYDYDACVLGFPTGKKKTVQPGTCVVVNFFDRNEEKQEEQITQCPALVRSIWSVERNNPREKALNKEATAEEVAHDGLLISVSWLLDVALTKKLPYGKEYVPPYDIPSNERFYDPKIDTLLSAPIIDVIPRIVFLERRRNMSNRPAYPDPSTGIYFVNKIVGKENGKVVMHSISDGDYDESLKAHIQYLLKLHAPKEQDDTARDSVRPARRSSPLKTGAEKRKREEPPAKPNESAKKNPAPARGDSPVAGEAAARLSLGIRKSPEPASKKEKRLERRAERAEQRVFELEAKLQKAEKKIERVKDAKEAALAAAGLLSAETGTPRKHVSNAPVRGTSGVITLEKLNAVTRRCKIVGLEDEVNAAAGEIGEEILHFSETLLKTATDLEKRVAASFPRDEPYGRGESIREFVEYVRGSDPFALRLILGELDASSLEILRGEAEREKLGGKGGGLRARSAQLDDADDDDESDAADDDDESDEADADDAAAAADDDDDDDDDDIQDYVGLTEVQKENLRFFVRGRKRWRPNEKQIQKLESYFQAKLALNEPWTLSKALRVEIAVDLAMDGPAHESKVGNWFLKRRQRHRNQIKIDRALSAEVARSPKNCTTPKRKQRKSIAGPPYSNFVRARHASVAEENPEFKFGDISKALGVMWKELTKEEREAYRNI